MGRQVEHVTQEQVHIIARIRVWSYPKNFRGVPILVRCIHGGIRTSLFETGPSKICNFRTPPEHEDIVYMKVVVSKVGIRLHDRIKSIQDHIDDTQDLRVRECLFIFLEPFTKCSVCCALHKDDKLTVQVNTGRLVFYGEHFTHGNKVFTLGDFALEWDDTSPVSDLLYGPVNLVLDQGWLFLVSRLRRLIKGCHLDRDFIKNNFGISVGGENHTLTTRTYFMKAREVFQGAAPEYARVFREGRGQGRTTNTKRSQVFYGVIFCHYTIWYPSSHFTTRGTSVIYILSSRPDGNLELLFTDPVLDH